MQDHYFTMRFHTSSLAFSILAVMATNTFAQSEQQEDTASSTSTQVLPKIKVQAEKQEKNSREPIEEKLDKAKKPKAKLLLNIENFSDELN